MKLCIFIFFAFLSGCGYFQKEISTENRILSFQKLKLNTKSAVEVLWTENQIPRIKAENSEDLFYTLGAVQMHLRQSQLEIYRKISMGALSEMAGPVSIKLDRFLKSIDFDHAARLSLAQMSPGSIQILTDMSRGMNDYLKQVSKKSSDLKILGIRNQDWSALDLVRIIKFTSIDVNWMVLSQLLEIAGSGQVDKIWSLKVNEKDFFDEFLVNLKSKKKETVSKFQSTIKPNPTLLSTSSVFKHIQSITKAGSNAFVVHGQKTKSKSAVLSSDPHLGFVIPNIWLFVILDSPEYKTMGYIIPSFPLPVIGRNLDIAWGGTNLWGISTFPTLLSLGDEEKIIETTQNINVRLWPDRKVKTYKLGRYPVLRSKDFPEIGTEDIVFRWQGYQPSNELETFMQVNKAKNFNDFKLAFKSYAVAGMTFVYGDKLGNIGKVVAITQPQVSELKMVYQKEDFKNESLNSLALPSEYNPKNNIVVSANDFTSGLRQPLSLFQAPLDRKKRMEFLLSQKNEITLEDVKEIQKDVFSQTAYDLKNKLVDYIKEKKWVSEIDQKIFTYLEAWDGNYKIESKGALIFEVFVAAWSKDIISNLVLKDSPTPDLKDKMFDVLVKNFNYRKFLTESLIETEFLTETKYNIYLAKAIYALEKFKNWGEFHLLVLKHPLGNLKIFKFPYSFFKGPWPGGNETLMKASHSLSTITGKATFGAQARWMTDTSDINENYLVYLGGQDGFIKSENINDLTAKWQDGSYLKVSFDRDQFLKISNIKGQ